MDSIGRIARLQIQVHSVKLGERPARWYDPAGLVSVAELVLSASGVLGIDAQREPLLDIHHRQHPGSKHVGHNSVSVGFTASYRAMRARFGDHIADGVAAENILVETHARLDEADLLHGLTIQGQDGQAILLERMVVAEPCVEFTRYCLRYAASRPADAAVTEGVQFLRRGLRGFYASYVGDPVQVRVGDSVSLAQG
jgi:hypothetical protein